MIRDKQYIEDKFTHQREPLQSHWHDFIDSSLIEPLVRDSKDDYCWAENEYALTALNIYNTLSLPNLESIVDDVEELVEELELFFQNEAPFDFNDEKVFPASAIAAYIRTLVDEWVQENAYAFILHKNYVDRVIDDGGEVVSLNQTLEFFKELTQ
jgi:hypothetical protein